MSTHDQRQPRKVLHILNSPSGGAALSTLGLIDAFRVQGIPSCAVCYDTGNQHERDALGEATGGETLFTPLYWWNKKIRTPLWKRPLTELKQGLRTAWARRSSALVARFAVEHGADLIHTNTILTPEGSIAARRLRLPHVWHLRELLGPGKPFRMPYEGPAFGQYLSTRCSKLVANSFATAELVRDWVGNELLEIVPNGIDISRFTPRTAPSTSPRVVVAMVGNLTARWKKHALLVDAAGLVDRGLPVEFRFYGHDPSAGGTISGDRYLDALHARIRQAGTAERFRWPGFVADPCQIMSEIDVLVHPADDESFGRAVVEAMAAAVPVVGVRGGGVGEIVEHEKTGLLAATDDARGLAEHITRLATDPALRLAFGQAGRQRAVDRYSLEACAANMLRVYGKALERPLGTVPSSGRQRLTSP